MATETDSAVLLDSLRISRVERDEAPSSRPRWLIVAGVAAALVAGAAVLVLTQRNKPVAVDVAMAAPPAANKSSAAILQATGYVTARRSATVSAQITGSLRQVLIEEGEHVLAGQVMAQLDDTAQQSSLAQSQAQLHAAEALLGQFEAQLEQAQRDLRRNEQLAGGAIAQQDLDNSRTQVRTMTAQLESQRRQLELARATVRSAEVQLSYTTIKAPFSGVVTAKAAQAGEIVSPMSAGGGFTRTGIGTIVDMDSLEIEVDVNEAYLHRIHRDQKAQATLDAYADWNIPAHVITIIPTADRSKATVKVRVGIEQKDPRILPDMGVRVSFLEDAPEPSSQAAAAKGVLVPSSAIVERQGKQVVYALDGERTRIKSVVPVQAFGDLRLVEGLDTGAKVVLKPGADLTDGARVSVQRQ